MAYFNQQFIDFFKGLAANNNRDHFLANKSIYEKQVKKPFQQLIQDCINEIGKTDPEVKGLALKDSLFRINRDIRFSKDKAPYKLHVGAVVSPTGRKDMQHPGLYIHLSIDRIHLGGGMYMPSKENLEHIRRHMLNNYKGFQSALNAPSFKATYGQLVDAERNKILPQDFKKYGQDYPELFLKQLYYMADYDGEDHLLRDDLLQFVVEHHFAAKELNQWFKDALRS